MELEFSYSLAEGFKRLTPVRGLGGIGRPLSGSPPPGNDRIPRIAALYREGQTLNQIGIEYGVSRERIRQLLKRVGMTGDSGGRTLLSMLTGKKKNEEKINKRENRYQKIFGCSVDAFIGIHGRMWSHADRYTKTPAGRFYQQKRNAGKRGIGWGITLPQWWTMWQESGKWDLRGRGQGYCMARHGDSGGYTIDNVYICTIGQNFSDSYLRHSWEDRFNRQLAWRDEDGLTILQGFIYWCRKDGMAQKDIRDFSGLSTSACNYFYWQARKILGEPIGEQSPWLKELSAKRKRNGK